MIDFSRKLNPEKALIWRIVHLDNIPWILQHGLHCGNSYLKAPHWVSICNSEIIKKRASRTVPVGKGGTLNDYVPFYFTPFSPMMLNIRSGIGVVARHNKDLIILVSSLPKVQSLNISFVFTDL